MLKSTALAAMFPCAALAQTPCMERADASQFMYASYGESIVGEGVTRDGLRIVIFANPDTGSFTLTRAEGSQLCLMGDGFDWVITAPLPVGDPV